MRKLSVLACLVLTSCVALSQQFQTGLPAFGSFEQAGFDTINRQDLNVNFGIPIVLSPGRATDFNYALIYDSLNWYPYNGVWAPTANFGWKTQGESVTGSSTYRSSLDDCEHGGHIYYVTEFWGYTYTDPSGNVHSFNLDFYNAASYCHFPTGPRTAYANDESGYYMDATNISPLVYDKHGNQMAGCRTDTNGNSICKTVHSSETDWTDTLGRTTLKVIQGTNTTTYEVLDQNGGYQNTVENFQTLPIKTNFGCPGLGEYTGSASLPVSIVFPTGQQYSFSYEPTPNNAGYYTGRLQRVTLPTNGYIEYDVPTGAVNDGINCADGSVNSLNRVAGGDGTTPTTQFSRSGATTTITSPTSNDAVYTFSGVEETARSFYQGTGGSRTLLRTITTTWAANATPSVTITKLENNSTQSEADTTFDNYGNLLSLAEYDWGSGTRGLLRRSTTQAYVTNSAYISRNMLSLLTQRIVSDGSGTVQSHTDIAYDGTSLTCVTGAAQHDDVNYGCSFATRGNATSFTSYADAVHLTGSLATTFNYDSVGNRRQQFLNGVQQTQWDYTSATQYAYPSDVISGPPSGLQLQTNFAYIFSTGQLATATDPNNQSINLGYDVYRRRTSTTDQAGYTTTITYNSATLSNAYLIFNGGNSIVSDAITVDSLGRQHIQQAQQGIASGTYDSVETDYNSLGLASRVTLPYAQALGQPTCPTCPAVTTSYDALGRPTQVAYSVSGGGSTSYSYNNNDVLVTAGPASTGENVKSRQLEYDALGRLTSVCEITSAVNGGTSCSQNTPATGFKTSYTYDALGNLLTVNQSGQPRTYAYDSLGRMTSETNPESATTAYVYDSLSSSDCGYPGSYSSPGDLIYKADANGNHICYYYDALHRLTDVGNNHQGVSNPCLRFRYDNTNGVLGAKPTGVSISNPIGRLAEAETDDCSGWPITQASIVTDEWSSYSPRGETTDLWESTRHSGGYYHSTASYWANGALNMLNPLNSTALPIFTYNADGEGRPSSVTANAGTNPVSSTAYNVASQPTGVTFGTADTDTFVFDANTGWMTQYKFSVGTTPTTVTGNLTWNANGTLATLGITDQFNSQNTQNCSYGYDDLSRIGSVNCGSVWSQAFGYPDAFGNLTKSGNASLQVTYDTTKNQISPGQGFTYDANGNTTQYNTHAYTWNVQGHLTGIDAIVLTYDVLGRMVEQQNGSSYTQILYGPSGGKLALMNGQTVRKAFILLPAGATAVYTAGPTLSYFRHPDWLGSSRFASTPSRTMYSDLAYAPFGETYAEAGTPDRSFTGQNQDTIQDSTTGLYDFMFREYAQYGRWISPDPAGLAAVDIRNPQTWNRYAYVMNNPLSFVDPYGLSCLWDDGSQDDAPSEGGATQSECTQQGGTWVGTDITVSGSLLTSCWFCGSLLWGTLPDYSSLRTPARPPQRSPNNPTIRSSDKIHCAAAVANSLSLANQPSLPGPSNPNALDKAVAYGANAVFGNTISGMVDFYDTARTATNAAPVYGALITNGVRMGVPGGGVLSKGVVGVAQDKVLQGAFSNLGVTASVTAGNVIGGLKFGYDGLTFLYGLIECTNF